MEVPEPATGVAEAYQAAAAANEEYAAGAAAGLLEDRVRCPYRGRGAALLHVQHRQVAGEEQFHVPVASLTAERERLTCERPGHAGLFRVVCNPCGDFAGFGCGGEPVVVVHSHHGGGAERLDSGGEDRVPTETPLKADQHPAGRAHIIGGGPFGLRAGQGGQLPTGIEDVVEAPGDLRRWGLPSAGQPADVRPVDVCEAGEREHTDTTVGHQVP